MNKHPIASVHRRNTALQRFNERVENEDDSWYTERLELLGKVMFGDLWKPAREITNDEVRGANFQNEKNN